MQCQPALLRRRRSGVLLILLASCAQRLWTVSHLRLTAFFPAVLPLPRPLIVVCCVCAGSNCCKSIDSRWACE